MHNKKNACIVGYVAHFQCVLLEIYLFFFGEGGVGGEDTCASTIKVWTFIAVLLLLMTDRTYMSFTKEPEIVFFS